MNLEDTPSQAQIDLEATLSHYEDISSRWYQKLYQARQFPGLMGAKIAALADHERRHADYDLWDAQDAYDQAG